MASDQRKCRQTLRNKDWGCTHMHTLLPHSRTIEQYSIIVCAYTSGFYTPKCIKITVILYALLLRDRICICWSRSQNIVKLPAYFICEWIILRKPPLSFVVLLTQYCEIANEYHSISTGDESHVYVYKHRHSDTVVSSTGHSNWPAHDLSQFYLFTRANFKYNKFKITSLFIYH